MDVHTRTFESAIYSILEVIESSRFVCISLKLSGSPPALPQAIPTIDYEKPTLQQRYEVIKKAAEWYQTLQFGLTCVKEDVHQKRYALSTYNFNLQPVPNKTLHISRQLHVDPSASNISSITNAIVNVCVSKGIPYCSREEEDQSRTAEYGDAQRTENGSKILQRDSSLDLDEDIIEDLVNGLEKFFYLTQSYDGSRRLRARRPGSDPPVCSVPIMGDLEKALVYELVKKDYPELCITKQASRGPIRSVRIHVREEFLEELEETENSSLEEKLRCQTGFRFIAEALCPEIDQVLDTRPWSPLGYDLKDCEKSLLTPKFLTSLIPPPPPKRNKPDTNKAPGHINTKCEVREANLKGQYSALLTASRQKKIMLVGNNLLVDLAYFFNSFFGPLPADLEQFVPIMKAMFPLIVDADLVSQDNTSSAHTNNTKKRRRTPNGPKIHERYPVKTSTSNAGCESYLTTVAFLNLAASEDDVNGFLPAEGHGFWGEVGNRINVRGTQEEILHLDRG